jgi:penicillin-binding protein 1A
VFQKLREAALAYHLERRWSKQKIITEYLNTVYFGNGAYGVEAAVRTYFGSQKGLTTQNGVAPGAANQGINRLLAGDVTPAQAALLAGMISSPSLYDPVDNPRHSLKRRNLVLKDMLQQDTITRAEYGKAIATPLPTAADINPPNADSTQPYYSSWLTQQLVDRYGSGAIFGGGLKIKTTIDPELQTVAEQAISRRLTGVGPSASMVAIENKTGEVKAMVGGDDFQKRPFNLATNGHRQPGSAFKPFTLIASLERGVSPEATFASQKKIFPVPGSKTEKFVVNNYDNEYSGVASLRSATATSDNSVFAELGLKTGTRKIAHLAQRMGIQTPVSHNPAMTLGGLKEGLTPLEMAYAYSTIANKGRRISGSLSASKDGPVAIEQVNGGGRDDHNQKRTERVFPASVGETTQELLNGVITSGTGKAAQIGEFAAGKTGTTENYGDAWFVGFNKQLTVAVWVGYPDKLKDMKTEYHGGPVAGGTFPAEIWHDFMATWIRIRDEREAAKGNKHPGQTTQPTIPSVPSSPSPSGTAPVQPQAPAPQQGGQQNQQGPTKGPRQPSPPKRTPTPAPSPNPQPSPPTGGGGTGEGGAAPGGAN